METDGGRRVGVLEELREEARELLVRLLREEGFVTVRLVVFDLPTEYRGSVTTVVYEPDGVVERKVLRRDTSVFRTLRRRFYEALNSTAFKTKAGWVLLPGADPAPLERLMEELNRLAGTRRAVELVEVAVPAAWLRLEAEEWRGRLELSLAAIAERLADAALRAAARRRLERRRRELERALQLLRRFISQLR